MNNIPLINIQAYRTQYANQNRNTQVPIIITNENIHNQRNIGTHIALSQESRESGAINGEYGCYQSNACARHTIYSPPYFNSMRGLQGENEWFW